MFGLLAVVMVGGAAALALWTIFATLGSRFELIVTLLRHGAQPFASPVEPAPTRITLRPVRRMDPRPALVVPGWREAA